MSDAPGTVAVIGLGAMGSAMAGNLLSGGHAVLGVDVDPDRCRALEARGGWACTLREAGRQAQVVVTSLPSEAAACDVLGDGSTLYQDLPPGAVVVETSTLSLAAKTSLQAAAARHGAVLLDCPMSGTSAQAQARDLVALLSGDDAGAKASAGAVLHAVARDVRDLGAFGNGTKTKLVANLLVGIHNAASAEALAFAARCGLDLDVTLAAVAGGAGGSRMLELRGPLMTAGQYEPAAMRVELFRKDLRLIGDLAREVGCRTPLLAVVQELYAEAMAAGMGQWDTASVFELLRGDGSGESAGQG